MKSSFEFATFDELERAVAQFRHAGVPGDTVPKINGMRGGAPYTLMFDFVPESDTEATVARDSA